MDEKFNILENICAEIQDRDANPKENSYTNYLLNKGLEKICKKVGEESAEVIIAAIKDDKENLINEISDLAYHVLILMYKRNITLQDIAEKLKERTTVKGNLKQTNTGLGFHAEKLMNQKTQ